MHDLVVGKKFEMRDGSDKVEVKVVGKEDEFYVYESCMVDGSPSKPQLATLRELLGRDPMAYRPVK